VYARAHIQHTQITHVHMHAQIHTHTYVCTCIHKHIRSISLLYKLHDNQYTYVEKIQCQNTYRLFSCEIYLSNFAHRGNAESIITIRCTCLDLKNTC